MTTEDVVNKRTYIEIFSSVKDLFYSLQARKRDDVTKCGVRAFQRELLLLASSLINLDDLTSSNNKYTLSYRTSRDIDFIKVLLRLLGLKKQVNN